MQAPRNKVVCVWNICCSVVKLNIFSNGNEYTTRTRPFKEKESYPNIFTSCLRYKLLLEIQTILGNKCTTLVCLFTKKYVKQQWERMLFEDILFPPFGQAYYTNNILLNTELLTSVKDWYLGSPRTQKKLEEHLLGSFLFLDSEVFIGYRAEKKNWKKLEENQKNKRNQKKCLGRNVVPKDFF